MAPIRFAGAKKAVKLRLCDERSQNVRQEFAF